MKDGWYLLVMHSIVVYRLETAWRVMAVVPVMDSVPVVDHVLVTSVLVVIFAIPIPVPLLLYPYHVAAMEPVRVTSAIVTWIDVELSVKSIASVTSLLLRLRVVRVVVQV